MKRTVITLASLSLLFATACGDDGSNAGTPDAGNDPFTITGDITADTTWTTGNTYTLTTNIFVHNATLTIEPGVTIVGDAGSSLVITNTAKIMAEGTASQPIIMTSSKAAGSRMAGDWGGLILLGKAPINVTGGTDNIEGFPAGTPGTEFGGSDPTHNCGTVKYVRIEFAGFELSTDNELNGLTVGACGSDTVIDYLQVHKGADDAVEFFGGTASITHAVLTQCDDDGLDWDFGWSGKAQFIVIQQSATTGNHGFEADNNVNSNDATPRSSPEIWNATLIGSDADPGSASKTQGGMMLRRGTAGMINNTIVEYFADWAVDVADYSTVLQATASTPTLAIQNSYFYQNANDANNGWPTGFDEDQGVQDDCDSNNANCFDEAAHFMMAAYNNTFADPGLGDPKNLTAPNFAPTSPLTGGGTPSAGFDTSATFIGAIGSEDWTSGWTAYPAN